MNTLGQVSYAIRSNLREGPHSSADFQFKSKLSCVLYTSWTLAPNFEEQHNTPNPLNTSNAQLASTMT